VENISICKDPLDKSNRNNSYRHRQGVQNALLSDRRVVLLKEVRELISVRAAVSVTVAVHRLQLLAQTVLLVVQGSIAGSVVLQSNQLIVLFLPTAILDKNTG
jgi:hypothetical protein